MTRTLPAGLTVRPRVDSDFPALELLLKKQQPESEYPVCWPLDMPVRDFIQRTTERHAWVAEVDGEVLGHIAVLTAHTDDGHGSSAFQDAWIAAHAATSPKAPTPSQLRLVAVFFTDLDHSGSGIGHHLFDTAVETAWGEGYPVLDCLSTHPKPIRFYEKRGWKIVGKARVPWDPAVPHEAFAMVATPKA